MNIERFLDVGPDERLLSSGWLKLEGGPLDEQALSSVTELVARRLGTPARGRSLPFVEALKPHAPDEASIASLSGKYGFAQFPFHVDGAHWTVPARFLVLACVKSDETRTPTLLVDRKALALTPEEEALVRSSTFLVRNGRKSFYASMQTRGQPFFRLDPGCMEPLTADSEEALELFAGERLAPHIQSLYWEAGDVAVVDNWRMLHARAPVVSNKSDRTLLRCLVS